MVIYRYMIKDTKKEAGHGKYRWSKITYGTVAFRTRDIEDDKIVQPLMPIFLSWLICLLLCNYNTLFS